MDHLAQQYASMGDQPFIADRTPFDVLGYSMAEIQRETTTGNPLIERRLLEQVDRALEITRNHLRGIVLLNPIYGAPDVETSAQACPFYMQHVYACIREQLEALHLRSDSWSYHIEDRDAPLVDRKGMLMSFIQMNKV
ncbi:AAA family ATPase [Xanthomonas phage JGB6]|nr:AAA family ATPase [Xanthomonas phage JGB6]